MFLRILAGLSRFYMFPKVVARDQVVDIVYNFYEYAKEVYLPEAYIVSRDQEGLLAHIHQKATTETIGAFGLALLDHHRRLFTLVDELQPDALVKQFHQGRRKPPPLEQMMEDRTLLRSIQRYIHRRLDNMLQLITKHEIPISLEVERRVLVKDFVVSKASSPLEPSLYFRKTATAVEYQLQLTHEGQTWPIQDSDVIALTNEPGWVIAHDTLYKLANINGFLVKPFRQKSKVRIPSSSVQAYFRNFILKIASKVDIEAEGFAVEQFTNLDACRLEAREHLFDGSWVLNVSFVYHDAEFNWQEDRETRTTLDMQEQEVRILQVRRDKAAEQIFVDKIAALPLQQVEGSAALVPEHSGDNNYALLEWLAIHKAELEESGFQVGIPQVGEKTISLVSPNITIEVSTDNDWFDLKGMVSVGEYQFPFLDLAKYIRDGNRFFPLPSGRYFLIPEEWMARYKEVSNFGQRTGEKLRLTKSQYTLLETLDIPMPEDLDNAIDESYEPSPLLKAQLRPYQLEGVQWLARLYKQDLGACLADDMGLGKTLQTIAILLYAKEQRSQQENATEAPIVSKGNQLGLFAPAGDEDFLQPLHALIVLPASLLFNWESEIKKFVPAFSIYQHFGPKRFRDARLLARFDVILTTYQTALRDVELLEQLEYEYIVLDESQQIKNRESKVFKAINRLQAKHKLSLSGTPIENSLSDLWSQMQFINEGLLGSFNFFKKEFIIPIEKQQDEERKDKLRKLVAPYLLRRTKEEVAKDLPSLSTQTFYTEMAPAQRKIYEREKSAARNYLLDNFAAADAKYRLLVVQTLTKLRQIVNHPVLAFADYEQKSGKFQDITEQWEVLQRAGHKVLLFSSFVKHLELFRSHFDTAGAEYAWLSGSTPNKQRQKAIKRFQEDATVQSFLISIKSGGTGLNLTAADYVFILDPWWNPTTEQQAIARAHRIGQKNNVIALKFITRDSIEEKILKLQERKLQLAEDILGSNGKMSLERNDLDFLLS